MTQPTDPVLRITCPACQMTEGHACRDDKFVSRSEVHPEHLSTWAAHPFPQSSAVDHPAHYGGANNVYETIKVIEAWNLDFLLGNAVKYISRAGKKDPAREVEDLQKALFYVNARIEKIKKGPRP